MRLLHGDGVAVGELEALVPVGVDGRNGAGFVELGDLFGGQIPAGCIEILAKLLFVAGAQDD